MLVYCLTNLKINMINNIIVSFHLAIGLDCKRKLNHWINFFLNTFYKVCENWVNINFSCLDFKKVYLCELKMLFEEEGYKQTKKESLIHNFFYFSLFFQYLEVIIYVIEKHFYKYFIVPYNV